MATTQSSEPSAESISDRVYEDSELLPAEKETTINFDKSREKATVFSAAASIVRRLIKHTAFEIEDLTEKDGDVVSVLGKIPVAALKVVAHPRSDKGHRHVVSNLKSL